MQIELTQAEIENIIRDWAGRLGWHVQDVRWRLDDEHPIVVRYKMREGLDALRESLRQLHTQRSDDGEEICETQEEKPEINQDETQGCEEEELEP